MCLLLRGIAASAYQTLLFQDAKNVFTLGGSNGNFSFGREIKYACVRRFTTFGHILQLCLKIGQWSVEALQIFAKKVSFRTEINVP